MEQCFEGLVERVLFRTLVTPAYELSILIDGETVLDFIGVKELHKASWAKSLRQAGTKCFMS